MPMPPPKPSSEGGRDRHVPFEIDQLVRVVEARGPVSRSQLAELAGADFWAEGRFERAVTFAVTDARLVRGDDDLLRTPD